MKVIMNMNESIMDSIKGFGKKMIDGVKNAFKENPKVTVTKEDGQEFIGYIRDYDEKNDICEIVVMANENESLLYSTIAASQAASKNSGSSYRDCKKPTNPKFNVGEIVLINGEGFDNEDGKVIDSDKVGQNTFINVQFGV